MFTKQNRRGPAILIKQDEQHVYDELLVVTELAARTYGSKARAILVMCEESPTYRNFSSQIAPGTLPLPAPPSRREQERSKRRRRQRDRR